MPKPIAALARAYQRDALKIVTTGTDRGHGDIAYQAIAVAPNDIEHSVVRSEEHTSELQSLMRTSYAVFCLKKQIDSHGTQTSNDNTFKHQDKVATLIIH